MIIVQINGLTKISQMKTLKKFSKYIYINEKYQIYTLNHEKKKTSCRRWQFRGCKSNNLTKYTWTILNSNTIYKGMVDNPLHIKINSQLNANASTIKIN